MVRFGCISGYLSPRGKLGGIDCQNFLSEGLGGRFGGLVDRILSFILRVVLFLNLALSDLVDLVADRGDERAK